MADPLRTGLSGLLAFQRAIATTSHNIANANTDGYSRQRVNLTPHPPEAMAFGYIGRGVSVDNVQRIQDQFAQSRLSQTGSEYARSQTYHSLVSRIDNLIADGNAGLSPVMENFFNSVQDLNNDPTSQAAREAMLSSAQNLSSRFNTLQNQFDGLQNEVNSRLSASVNQINSLASNIVKLNNDIMGATSQASGSPPNDLLDQRDNLVNELSQYTSINTVSQDDGSLNVFIGNGISLVVGTHATELGITSDPNQPEVSQVGLVTSSGVSIISNQLTGGSIGGTMDFRRESLDPITNELGRMSMVLADSFNQQHHQGMDLNGNMGTDFFNTPQIQAYANNTNTGTADVTAVLTDASSLTASDYRLDYDGSNYNLTRLSDNSVLTGGLPLSMDGIEITTNGTITAGDSFLIRPTAKAARDISLGITNANSIAIASPLASTSVVTNSGNATVSAAEVIDVNNPDFGDTIEISFNTPATTFDLINTSNGTTIGSNISFTEGADIDIAGARVQINGAPQPGDIFRIESGTGSSSNNRNGLSLAGIQNLSVIGGQSSLQEGYANLVGRVGSNTRQAELNTSTMDGLFKQAQETRDGISGVNLDEEAINLTRYQQAYQAAAQVISTADSMFQTLIGAIRR